MATGKIQSLYPRSSGTLSTSSSQYLSSAIDYIRIGAVCSVQVRALQNIPSESSVTIGTLPAEFRPIIAVEQTVIDGTTSLRVVRIIIQKSGNVDVYNYGNQATSLNIRAILTYLVEPS